ncbi:hypothetical protein EVAR_39182_1 [Eumeta japonica]|uniref:Uncharacterized protein n=1 Tax=Eumeta variegata TaxID=151549 RepID=A0A4C1VQ09_EUMVA|nr:hypothetical protein EVAR_39182_1 [Eumeta japonica]
MTFFVRGNNDRTVRGRLTSGAQKKTNRRIMAAAVSTRSCPDGSSVHGSQLSSLHWDAAGIAFSDQDKNKISISGKRILPQVVIEPSLSTLDIQVLDNQINHWITKIDI